MKETSKNSLSRRSFLKGTAGLALAACAGGSTLSLVGCGSSGGSSESSGEMRTEVNIGYWGSTTCDCAQLAAYEFGKYEEQGLSPTLCLIDYTTYSAMASRGELDQVSVGPNCFKQLEQGAGLKLVNGDHTGCCSFVVGADSDITDASQLAGKSIGIEAIGGASQMLMSVKLGMVGLDYESDVEWRVYDYSALEPALVRGEIDCFGYWDPVCRQAIDNGSAKLLFRMSSEEPFDQYVCCYEAMSVSVVEEELELARRLDAAWREGVKLCRDDPHGVAEVLVEKKYVSEDVDFTERCLRDYLYWTEPSDAATSYQWWLGLMKDYGILDESTDIDELYAETFASIDET